jgi:hypothetical protein
MLADSQTVEEHIVRKAAGIQEEYFEGLAVVECLEKFQWHLVCLWVAKRYSIASETFAELLNRAEM